MLTVEKKNDISLVKFENTDRFNAILTEPFKEQLKALYNNSETKLALSLEGIKFIDSSGFGALLSIMKTAANNNGAFKMCNVGKEVMKLFKLLQLNNVFEIHETTDDCLNSFN